MMRGADLAGAEMCPYRLVCGVVSDNGREAMERNRESTEVAIILANEIIDLRGAERTNATLNEILKAARMRYRSEAGLI